MYHLKGSFSLCLLITLLLLTVPLQAVAQQQATKKQLPETYSAGPQTDLPVNESTSFAQKALLWQQPISGSNTGAYASQDFEPALDDFDVYIADDFKSNSIWSIESIFVPGHVWNGGTDLMNAHTLNWVIYKDDSGLPAGNPSGGGDPVHLHISLPPSDSQVSLSTGVGGYPSNVTLNLDIPIVLSPATYWFIFYPEMDFNPHGQYGVHVSDTTNGYKAMIINPGEGFGMGPDWRDNDLYHGISQQDIAFTLRGEILTSPSIPTLSQWGQISLIAIFALGILVLSRHRGFGG